MLQGVYGALVGAIDEALHAAATDAAALLADAASKTDAAPLLAKIADLLAARLAKASLAGAGALPAIDANAIAARLSVQVPRAAPLPPLPPQLCTPPSLIPSSSSLSSPSSLPDLPLISPELP